MTETAINVDAILGAIDAASWEQPIETKPNRATRRRLKNRTVTKPIVGVAYAGKVAVDKLMELVHGVMERAKRATSWTVNFVVDGATAFARAHPRWAMFLSLTGVFFGSMVISCAIFIASLFVLEYLGVFAYFAFLSLAYGGLVFGIMALFDEI